MLPQPNQVQADVGTEPVGGGAPSDRQGSVRWLARQPGDACRGGAGHRRLRKTEEPEFNISVRTIGGTGYVGECAKHRRLRGGGVQHIIVHPHDRAVAIGRSHEGVGKRGIKTLSAVQGEGGDIATMGG